MAFLSGYTPSTPYRALVGPGVGILNPDETLLSPATAWNAAAQDAFLNSGTVLGATSDGWEFSYEPEYQEWEFAGVPGNVRGGRRLTRADVSVSASLTEVTDETLRNFMPGVTSAAWQTTEVTPTVIGTKLEHEGTLLDSSYINTLAIVGERQGQKIGGIFLIRNAINTEGFSIGLDGGQDRTTVDMTFNGTYGAASYNAATGAHKLPVTIYLSTPAVAV